jgi:hypothetical protein
MSLTENDRFPTSCADPSQQADGRFDARTRLSVWATLVLV